VLFVIIASRKLKSNWDFYTAALVVELMIDIDVGVGPFPYTKDESKAGGLIETELIVVDTVAEVGMIPYKQVEWTDVECNVVEFAVVDRLMLI